RTYREDCSGGRRVARNLPSTGSEHALVRLKPAGVCLPSRARPLVVIEKALERAFESLRYVAEQKLARRELNRAAADLEALNKIGTALSAERDTDALLALIVAKSREITRSDAGSLYLVEEKPDGAKHLVFKLIESDTREFLVPPHSLPISKESMAGH